MEICYMSSDDTQRLWSSIDKMQKDIQNQTVLAATTADRVEQMTAQMSAVVNKIENLPCTSEEIERIKMEGRLQERLRHEAAQVVKPMVEEQVREEVRGTWKRMFAVVSGAAGLISMLVGWIVAYVRVKGSH